MYPRGGYYLFRREFINTTFLNTGMQQEAARRHTRKAMYYLIKFLGNWVIHYGLFSLSLFFVRVRSILG